VIIEDLVNIGRDQARTDIFVRLFARRLGRALTDREGATLSQRIETLSADRLDDVLLNSSSKTLAAWLADPAAR
jgi:hypothetical protein